ncbi:hypothetical protein PSCICO_25070 [Pseudomonas cichorii]|uniref:Uncharacterized protein n=1 Tax=Pseudomonas serbiensis TaxID=3064350 RepID=A0ABT9CUC0_9PSED|nr:MULTISPECIES: hypothetical protein [Pseudomonas]MDO7929098.1 hypothetical protein [Pseudomonas sp. KFB-138]GFM87108.1 hypothetical protein PSCICO_25070 [Pseudomonas cichorii]
MTELQHTVSTPELYERLIHRLGLALETANTAVRLRNESPVELELEGLSNAELEFIEAYLEKGTMEASGAVKGKSEGSFIVSPEQAQSIASPKESARIIWLKDKRRARASTGSGRYTSNTTFKL